jgi:phosphatidylserine/phosphatidylglycerophosphate/cardiolipin synthase-like enzyme
VRISLQELEEHLREAFADVVLDKDEKAELTLLVESLQEDEVRFLRNKGFMLAREALAKDQTNALTVLKWLEQVMKVLHRPSLLSAVKNSAHFSPGDACRKKIIQLIREASKDIEICVFTIADDSLAAEIVKAHRRGVTVRVITDNDKAHDMGSDIDMLAESGINVRMDRQSSHMHHKFALFDNRVLVNGSFNWTRSASRSNQENIVVTTDEDTVTEFQQQFVALWKQFAD